MVAVLMTSAERDISSPQLAAPVRGWLTRVKQQPTALVPPEARPEDYPDKVKERLLYVLIPNEPKVRIDIYKGRINAAGTGLNKAIRRYDALHALRSNAVAKFIRPTDLELLSALAQTRLWQTHYSYSLPDAFRPMGQDVLALMRRLCDTGRFLHDNAPDAQLTWAEAHPKARLAWRMAANGSQKLGFESETGAQLDLRALDGATLWANIARGQIGALAQPVPIEALHLVQSALEVAPDEATALAAEMPATLAGLALPPPHVARQIRRAAHKRIARLTLGAESARDGYRRWDSVSVTLPTLTLRFVYDGQEVWEGVADPRVVENNEGVPLTRDHQWEAASVIRLMDAGAIPVDDVDYLLPSARMLQ
ncbi:MAG: hypothetical protein ABJI09_07880, partial [Marinomonas sp.]